MCNASYLAAGLATLGLLLASTVPAHADPGVVQVAVANVRNDHGLVRVSICTWQEFLKQDCSYTGATPARRGTVTITVPGVAPGIYAVQAWHDEFNTGHVQQDFLGIPREGVGFSRNPMLLLGPPSFNDSDFQVGPNGGRTGLTLRYFHG